MTKEEEIGSDLIFLGWTSKIWITSKCKNSEKRLNTVVTESIRLFVKSWEERNEWIIAKENSRSAFLQRLNEFWENKSKHDDEVAAWIDEIMKSKTELTTKQLKTKMEITRMKMKEMKIRKNQKRALCNQEQKGILKEKKKISK